MSEKKSFKRYTVTSALPYANGPVHIGHLAGVYVPADIYVRYKRLRGDDVLFIGGSDEHGVPITIRARNEGKTPQEIVDTYHELIKTSFEKFGISFDVYSRTSSDIHHETSAEIFKDLYDKGEFTEKTNEQFYDPKEKQFLADRYIIGECPVCHFKEAYGDQCENCGSSLTPEELIEPKSRLSGEQPIKKVTKHWYLPLDKYEPWLKEWILEGHKEWKPNVYGQCKSWIDNGLHPRPMTRDLDWGVKVPLEDAEGKVLYVWFDAPIGYISATKEWADSTGKDWKPYWQSEDSRLIHFIGKDNIVFHCIIFPAILHATGKYILPDNVPANEFLNLESNKISTSRNWAVWLHEFLEEMPGREDALRYALTANLPETKDNDFTWKDFQARNNNELVAIFGNFINRTVVLTHKYFDGQIPERNELTDFDRTTLEELARFPSRISKSLEDFKFREALTGFMDLARLGNKYLADTEPWKQIKSDPERVKTVLNISSQIAASLAVVGQPFLPFTMNKLAEILQAPLRNWDKAGRDDLLAAGHQLGTAELLFTKIENEEIDLQVEKLLATKKQNKMNATENIPAPKEEIEFDDFVKMDLRVGKILNAEKVPKSNKLLKLLVDVGFEQRTILSGIAKYFSPEQLEGQFVTVVANLKPRKMMGEESKGMVLMAEDGEGNLRLLQPQEGANAGDPIS